MLIKNLSRILILLLISLTLFSAMTLSDKFDPKVSNWYEVEDWEVEVCSVWGGLGNSQNVAGGISTGMDKLYQMAATLQGEYKNHVQQSNEEKIIIYEIAWYIQPISGNTKYTIYLVNKNGIKTEIDKGSATASTGDAGFYAEENDEGVYTHVLMEYETGTLKVPIVRGG